MSMMDGIQVGKADREIPGVKGLHEAPDQPAAGAASPSPEATGTLGRSVILLG